MHKRLVILVVVSCVMLPAALSGQYRYDPVLRFQVIETPHFLVHFHQGEEALARRLAVLAEEVHETLTERLRFRPRGRTRVILVDQSDLPNGWATPLPYNTIEVTAAAPSGASAIGNSDDWLRLVFAHEYTHILHLDQSRGWAALSRRLFGRAPFVFPNMLLPLWQIEGVAIHEETAVTGRGRIPAGDFAAILDARARRGGIDPVDRVNGGLIDWPSGTAPYLYGAYFHDYLGRRFGEDRLAVLGKETAGRLPYTSAGAYRKVYGQSLAALWDDFERERVERAGGERESDGPVPERLTQHGFVVERPRFLNAGVAGAEPSIVYSVRNPHRFPSLMQLPGDGSAPRRLAHQFYGSGASGVPGLLVFDQIDYARNAGLYSDLYAVQPASGRTFRLSAEARLSSPDVSPDGRLVAALAESRGARSMIVLPFERDQVGAGAPSLGPPVLELAEPETYFDSPRWSPNGRLIAVERRRLGGPSEIVVVDAATASCRVLVSSRTSRNVTPAWTPDGRTIVFASDRDGGPFNLFAVPATSEIGIGGDDLFPQHRITSLPGGALSPDVSPDGTRLVFTSQTAEGLDIFSLAVPVLPWAEAGGPAGDARFETAPGTSDRDRRAGTAAAEASAPTPDDARLDPETRPYSPLNTLAPRFWTPLLTAQDGELNAGLATGGLDALRRHSWSLSALWPAAGGPDLAPGVDRERWRPEWRISYSYTRWRPTLFATVSDERSFVPSRVLPGTSDELRQRTAAAGILMPLIRARWSHAWLASAVMEEDARVLGTETLTRQRNALRFGWFYNSSKAYGYSVSRVDGVTVAATSEQVRRGFAADGTADAFTADIRAYIGAGRHHVLAARAAGGTASGDQGMRRRFGLGGPGPRPASFDFGSGAVGLLRGYSQNAFGGRSVAVMNLDYRFPLLRVERGRGTLPVFMRTIHGSVFADAGAAWDDRFSSDLVRSSVGAELSLDLVAGYFLPLALTGGVAWTDDGDGGARRASFFFRVGRAF
jgi:hypothetical protein